MDHHDEIKFTYLLERPTQPLFMGPKGHGTTKYFYNLPADHWEPWEMQTSIEIRKLIPSTTPVVDIPVYHTTYPYDLKPIQEAVPLHVAFSELNEKHQLAAMELLQILMSQGSKADFFNACALCRDRVNTHLWVTSFARALLRRPDMRGFRLPAVWEMLPDLFIEAVPWQQGVAQAALPPTERAIIVIDKNFTGINLNPEHKVAYFGEDIGVNSHHWHWHVVNPFTAPKGTTDRKGEIFYYMHHGMLARYDAERLANGLNRAVPFDIHEDLIVEACFPKLTLQNSSTDFASRQENSIVKTMGFPTLQDIRAWLDRIIDAIDAGFAIQDGGGRVDLRTEQGINIVTNMWESNSDTPNRNYYGMAHNNGHMAIGFLHDPDNRYKTSPGVMQFTGTSMRDPVFFRWHRYLDLISQRQKDYLPPYPHENFQWNGIKIDDVQMIRTEPSAVSMPTLDTVNNMVSHWMQSDIEVSRGLDFGRSNVNGLGSIWVRATHLQHVPFTYAIRVTSQVNVDVHATVRVFLAPKLDENGDPLPFYQQRILFFEMDKFTTVLHLGRNMIFQKSEESTLTVPWSQTFRELERDTEQLPRTQVAMCGCGWPQHMLLPRGKLEGMPFDLFVMLTNSQIDQVPTSRRQLGTLTARGTCRDAVSYCGMMDDKFPDVRAMGYPFDRPAIPDERNHPEMFLADFVQPVSNMKATEIKIFHVDKTILRGNGAPDTLRKMIVKI